MSEVIYDLYSITNGICNRNTPRIMKMEVLCDIINPAKWNFLGFESNGSKVRLKPKFHNIRDSKGRFVSRKKCNTNTKKK